MSLVNEAMKLETEEEIKAWYDKLTKEQQEQVQNELKEMERRFIEAWEQLKASLDPVVLTALEEE